MSLLNIVYVSDYKSAHLWNCSTTGVLTFREKENFIFGVVENFFNSKISNIIKIALMQFGNLSGWKLDYLHFKEW